MMEEGQITRTLFKFEGTKLLEEEKTILGNIANQKFFNEGLTSFKAFVGSKTFSIKFLKSTYSGANGGGQAKVIFKVAVDADTQKLEEIMRELRTQIKIRERRSKRREYKNKDNKDNDKDITS